MPRNVDPGTITVGKGLAPEGTVEDTSFRYPERDVDPLRVHIHDPSRAHMASTIGIVDAGDCYVSDEVEGALQEICSGAGAGRLNGLISGGTFNELGNVANGSGSVATTTLTLETTTEIMVGPGVFNASALVASLSGLAAGSYYVYFDTNSSSPSFRTLVVSASAPQVETATGIEHVLIAKFAYDAGGNVTAWQDGRFFVRNLDRKVQYSSRQGENVDAWSEGCFATLQAFFLWMAEYGEGTGTPSEEEKGTVIIRGEHQFPSTLTIPTNHLQFVGDGNAILSTPVAGFTGTRLLDISGRTNITFRNLTFVARTAGLTAIFSSGQALSDIRVEGCTFSNSNAQWVRGVDLGNTTSTGENIYIKDSTFYIPTNAGGGTTHLGVNLYGVKHARVTGCRFIANGLQDTAGISIGETNHKSVDVVVSGCFFSGMALGMKVEFADHVKLVDNTIEGTTKGILSTRGTSAPNNNAASTDYLISGNSIELAPTGFVGVSLREVTAATIESNLLACSGSGPFGAVSDLAVGIEFTSVAGAAGLNGAPADLRITGNNIIGFYDTTSNPTPQGFPILVTGEGANNNPVKNVVIADNTINEGVIRIADSVEHFAITNNVLDGLIPGDPTVLSERAILITGGGSTTPPQNGVVSGNIIRRYSNGIFLGGSVSGSLKNVDVVQNHISNIAVSGTAFPDNSGFGTSAVALTACEHCSITRNTISDLGAAANNSGTPLVFANSIQCVPIYVRDCAKGIRTEGNTILNSKSQGIGKIFGIVYMITNGQAGAFTSTEHVVADNEIEMTDAGAGAGSFSGVYFNIGDSSAAHSFSRVEVRNNRINADGATQKAPSHGLLFQSQVFSSGNVTGSTYDEITVAENSVAGFRLAGIAFDNNAGANQVRPCVFRHIDILRNHLQSTTPVTGQDQGGIVLKVSAGAADSILNAVTIVQNKILMPNAPDGGAHYGINLVSNRTGATALFRGLVINENRIPTVDGGVGINVDRLGVHGASNRQDFQISRNRVGVGQKASGGTSGLQPNTALTANLGDSIFTGLRVDDNTFYTTGRSIFLTNITGGVPPAVSTTIEEVSLCRNILNRGTGLVSVFEGMNLTLGNVNFYDVSVCDNEVFGAAVTPATTTHSILIKLTNSSTGPVSVDRLKVCGNQIEGNSELELDIAGYKATNVSVNDNTLTNETTDTTAVSIHVGFGQGTNPAVTTEEVRSLDIKNNLIVGGNTGIEVSFDDVPALGVQVTGNLISGLEGDALVGFDGYDSTGIHYIIGGTANDLLSRNIAIEDNTITSGDGVGTDYSPAGCAISFAVNSATTRVSGLSVSRNKTVGPFISETAARNEAAIDVGFNGAGVQYIEDVQVDGNIIAPSGSATVDYANLGIIFSGPVAAASVVQNISVSGNSVDVRALTSGNEASGLVGGIGVSFPCLSSAAYAVQNVAVDGNRVVCGEGDGAPTAGTPYGISLNMTCGIRNLSASTNSIKGFWNEDATPAPGANTRINGSGLSLFHTFTTAEGVDGGQAGPPTNNKFYMIGFADNSTNADLGWFDGTNNYPLLRIVCWRNLNISGNTIMWNGGKTATVNLNDRGYAAMSLINVRKTAPLTTSAANHVTIVPMWGLTVSGNSLHAEKRGNTNFASYRGFTTRPLVTTAKWPGAANPTAFSSSTWAHVGVTITGNTAQDFKSKNAGGTAFGVCIQNLGDNLNADGAVVAVNNANDGGVANEGWDDLGGTLANNLNSGAATIRVLG